MKSKLGIVYVATALFSIHYFIITYLNSTFLLQYFSGSVVSIIYAAGSILTILLFLNINPLLRRIGNNHLFISISFIEVVTLIILALGQHPYLIAFAFILHHALYPVSIMCLDIYLEHWSARGKIGSVRGLYLITFNSCAPIAAIASGSLVIGNNFTLPYALSAIFMLALITISMLFLKDFKDSEYKSIERKTVLHVLKSNKKIFAAFSAAFLLQLSYTWLVIYIPLYLINTLGMSIRNMTIAVAISLISFVIFQAPLGKFSDRFKAERYVIRTGLAILLCGFLFTPFITIPDIILWAITLFILRMGASFVEIGADSYFFKQVDDTNSQMIEFWRLMDPLAFMTGTLIASIAILFIPISQIFFIIVLFLLFGVYISKNISYNAHEDTDCFLHQEEVPVYDLSYDYKHISEVDEKLR